MFSPNPAGDLAVVNDEGGGVRWLLTGGSGHGGHQALWPGAVQRRSDAAPAVCSEGLLGPAANGPCDLNAQDTARIGQPSPGQKAGVVRCQVSSGGKPQDPVAGAIVPPRPLPGEQSSNPAAKVEAAATNPSA